MKPPTRESSRLELDILCMLITRWTEKRTAYLEMTEELLLKKKDIFGEFDLEWRCRILTCVKFAAILNAYAEREFNPPLLMPFMRDMHACATEVESMAVSSQSPELKTCYMCVFCFG